MLDDDDFDGTGLDDGDKRFLQAALVEAKTISKGYSKIPSVAAEIRAYAESAQEPHPSRAQSLLYLGFRLLPG